MLASISAGYNSLFGNKESCENLENSEHSQSSDTGFSQPSSKSPMSSPELSRGNRSVDSPSTWSFTENSSSAMQEVAGEDVFKKDSPEVEDAVNPAQSTGPHNTSRSTPNHLDSLDNTVTLCKRSQSADFTLTAIEDMIERPESLRTLEDASSSSFPLDSQQRSGSVSTTASDPATDRRLYVTALVKRRREIEEDLAELNVQLLESYREEWILTGVVPEGFAEIQSQVFAFDPKLKTTSFPFTHLLPTSRSESNFKSSSDDKPSTTVGSFPLPGSEIDSGILHSPEENSTAFTCKDSLTSSFSSMMADSFYFSQTSDDSSTHRTCSFIHENNPIRDGILRRLEELKNDFAVVSQIYLIHQQRALETNQSAFRKACKCNVQKLKEIHQEKLALEARLRELDNGCFENLSCAECSGLSRSTSVSMKEDYQSSISSASGTPAVATLPRRRTLRMPTLTHSGTLRLGKLRRRPSVKQVEFESVSQVPQIIGSTKPVKQPSSGLRHVPSSLRGLRFQLLPARIRIPRSQTEIVQPTHLNDESVSVVPEASSSNVNMPRPCSMYARIYSNQRHDSLDDMRKAQIQKHFSASGPNLLISLKESEQESKDLEVKISPQSPTCGSELSSMLGASLNLSPSDDVIPPKESPPSSLGDSDEQSTSGAFSVTSQEFSLSDETEVCLRRPMKVVGVGLEESPIRCICSCISENGGGEGTCECSEEVCEESHVMGKSDSGLGNEEGEVATPTPVRSAFPVIMPSRPVRRSLNPFNLLRAQSGRRGPLWKR